MLCGLPVRPAWVVAHALVAGPGVEEDGPVLPSLPVPLGESNALPDPSAAAPPFCEEPELAFDSSFWKSLPSPPLHATTKVAVARNGIERNENLAIE